MRDESELELSMIDLIEENIEGLAIKSWAASISIEQFLKGVQERAGDLSEDQRKSVLDRLQLARDFIGTQDPLDFFCTWKTPSERYLPLAMRTKGDSFR